MKDELIQVSSQSLRQSIWYLIEKFFRLGGTFFMTTWIARHLGPTEFGTLAYSTAIISLLGFFGSLGLESIILRDLAQKPSQTNEIIGVYLGIRIFGSLTIPLFGCAYVFFAQPEDHGLLTTTVILSLCGLFMSLDVIDLVLQSRNMAFQTTLVRLTAFLISAGIKTFLILTSASLLWFAAAQAFELAMVAMTYAWAARKLSVSISSKYWDRHNFTTLLYEGRYMILSGLTVSIYSKLDLMVIGKIFSKDALASYAIAASVCGALNIVGMSLAQSFAPRLSRLRDGSKIFYLKSLRTFILTMLIASLAGTLILQELSSWLFDILLGSAYKSLDNIFSALIWSCIPVFLGVATSQIIVNDRLYFASLIRTALGMIFMGAFITQTAYHYGIIGVAWLVVASAWISTSAILFSSVARNQIWQILQYSFNNKIFK